MLSRVCLVVLFVIAGCYSQNPNCKVLVPPNPLTAAGLATPYQLSAMNISFGPCNMSNAGQTAFVQGVAFDTATNQFAVYNPLIIDAGSVPLVVPVAPNIVATQIVALWFGFNGNNLQLVDANKGATLAAALCVNGLSATDLFGEYSYCNAVAFYAAANAAIAKGLITFPPLGVGRDGNICPTTRDFSVVDMDPNDNVFTSYLLVGSRTAQNTAANLAALTAQGLAPQVIANPSDERLVDALIDAALGCKPMTAPDLADNNNPTSALPLNELFAAKWQTFLPALVPAGDPMVLSNGVPNLAKVNLYRAGVNQPAAATLNDANTTLFCVNFLSIAPSRLIQNKALTQAIGSPVPAAANTLFTFLGFRMNGSIGPAPGLNCLAVLGLASNPIILTMDGNGVVINVDVNFALLAGVGINPATIPANTQPLPVGGTTFPNVQSAKIGASSTLLAPFFLLAILLAMF